MSNTDIKKPVTISSDVPIDNRSQDILGYQPFAYSVARGITQGAPKEGFVLGIQAQWGMGKTSAVNLSLNAISELESNLPPNQKTRVQHFNPWLFSNFEALAKSYISQLGRVVEETFDQETNQKTRKVVEKLIKGGAELLGGAAAAGLVAVSGGVAAPAAMPLKSMVTGALNYGSYILDAKSIDTTIEELKSHLRGIDCRILIVIDDLDRLQPDELRQVITIIKTFGNLPNVIHLLVYDRLIVEAALSGPSETARDLNTTRRPTYLEKIVQTEFDLPPPSPAGLRKLTISKLTSILGPSPPMDKSDWFWVSHLAYGQYLRSPRDVMRLMNALAVTWPSIEAEVYLPDLLLIELLRHFDRKTYELVRTHGEFLCGGYEFVGDEARSAIVKAITESIPQNRRSEVLDNLCRAFPQAAKHLNNKSHSVPNETSVYYGRRIGYQKGFASYFRFASSPDVISVKQLIEMRSHLDDRNYLESVFEQCMATKKENDTYLISSLLEEIAVMLQKENLKSPALLEVIFSKGDRIISLEDEEGNFASVDNRWRMGIIFSQLPRALSSGVRLDWLSKALIADRSGIHVCTRFVAVMCEYHDELREGKGGHSEDPPLELREVVSLGSTVANRTRHMARDGTLTAERHGIDLTLAIWFRFGVHDEIGPWIDKAIANPESYTSIIFSQMNEGNSGTETWRMLRERPNIRIYDLAKLADVGRSYLEKNLIAETDVANVQRFIDGCARFLSGEMPGDAGFE